MRAKITNKLLATLKPANKPVEVYDSTLPGFLLRVQPSGVMTYYGSYRLASGQKRRVRIGDARVLTPAQGKDEARKILAQVTQGDDPQEIRRNARCSTLREYLDTTYGPWLIENRKSGTYMLERMKSAYAGLLDKRLTDINPWTIEQWRRPFIQRGSAASCNRHLSYLKAALTRAVEWKIVKVNSITTVKKLKEDHARQGQIRTLDPDEEVRLWEAIDAREERLRTERDSHNEWCRVRGYSEWPDLRKVTYADLAKPMITMALHCGLRRGELFSAEWRDMDLEKAKLIVRGEVAKSGKSRTIPMNDTVLDCLRRWREQSEGDGLLFPSPQGGGRLTDVKKLWATLTNAAQISGLRLHDLRHTFCSRLIQAGVDLQTVRELAGHSDITTTSVYLHSDPSAKIAAVSRLTKVDNVVVFKRKGDRRKG